MDTAHQETEAVTDVDSAATAIANMLGEESGERPEAETDEVDAEGDVELDDLEDEEGDGPEPATKAPVSLNADEKSRYAQLPPEAQQFVSELEARRATQVQQATTKASDAQRTAEARAATADAQAKAHYAQQLLEFADALAPQRPDPRLAEADPMQFIAQNAQYEAAKAQHDQFVQQVQSLRQDAETGVNQAFFQERDRQLMAIPEVQNETTRQDFLDKAFAAANFLGFDNDEVVTKASAQEIAMLRHISTLKEKADKYDAAMSRQMQRVRQGKTKAIRPGTPRGANNDLVKQFDQRPSRDTAAALLEAHLKG